MAPAARSSAPSCATSPPTTSASPPRLGSRRTETLADQQEEGPIIMAKRTTLRSSKGTKLYAVRDKKGKFKDIQSYKRAHGQDIKRKSKAETAKKAKKARKKK